ncbi:MAG TPA: hypothetical protein VGN86_12005 [Pyrinomonadaceae bacterium]|nr:hypothetical protein [Pyrinomonadaceae bacterium]
MAILLPQFPQLFRISGSEFMLSFDQSSSFRYQCRVALCLAFSFAAIFLLSHVNQAQVLTARVSLQPVGQTPKATIVGRCSKATTKWSFLDNYGRILGLADRISNLKLTDASDRELAVKKTGPGEFLSSQPAVNFSYDLDLSAPQNPADAAHVSWISFQRGFLMLGDLLPNQSAEPTRVSFGLPPKWQVLSSATRKGDGSYEVVDQAKAVFFVGSDLREKHKRIGNQDASFVSSGEWSFPIARVMDNIGKIMRDHASTTGLDLSGAITVMLAPYPGSTNRSGWSAEARGGNVILLASPDSPLSSGQLAVIMCHELFHLWMPNAVNFDGDFDWFFEGFTLYHALGTALRLKLIDFQEFLATLGRVYDSYQSSADRGKFSLIEFSRRRWTVGSSFVYDQGMLTAFLFDLKLRKSTNNQKLSDDLFRTLFSRYHGSTKQVDGNDILISMMAELTGREFVKDYVQTAVDIKLETLLPEYGMRLDSIGGRHRLEVAEPLSPEQQRLLSDLGYRKARARAAFIN